MIKIEQYYGTHTVQGRAKVPSEVYGKAIAVYVHWNERLDGSDASWQWTVHQAGHPNGVQIRTGWGRIPPVGPEIVVEAERGLIGG